MIGFFVLLIATIHETYVCLNRYLDYPKYTSNQLVVQNHAEFPALTFCNSVKMGYRENLLKV